MNQVISPAAASRCTCDRPERSQWWAERPRIQTARSTRRWPDSTSGGSRAGRLRRPGQEWVRRVAFRRRGVAPMDELPRSADTTNRPSGTHLSARYRRSYACGTGVARQTQLAAAPGPSGLSARPTAGRSRAASRARHPEFLGHRKRQRMTVDRGVSGCRDHELLQGPASRCRVREHVAEVRVIGVQDAQQPPLMLLPGFNIAGGCVQPIVSLETQPLDTL